MTCFAHTASTSQGRGYAVVSSEFTSLIAMSLAQFGTGSDDAFRKCIVEVLLASLLPVVDEDPFPDNHVAVAYLSGFLLDCLPATDIGKKRADALMTLLTGDIREPYIQLRIRGGQNNVDRQSWAESVAAALYPVAIAVFPRHRWCNYLGTLQSYALLAGVHDLLPRAGAMWLAGTVPARVCNPADVATSAAEVWALSDEEDDNAVQHSQLALPAVAGATAGASNPTSAFSEFNAQQRTKAKRWCASFPRDRLVVMMLALAVGLAAVRNVEYLASDQWQISQWNDCETSGAYSCRVLAVWEGVCTATAYLPVFGSVV